MVKKTTIKISKKLRSRLMKMKYDLGFTDVGEVIQRMHNLIIKNKLLRKMKDES